MPPALLALRIVTTSPLMLSAQTMFEKMQVQSINIGRSLMQSSYLLRKLRLIGFLLV